MGRNPPCSSPTPRSSISSRHEGDADAGAHDLHAEVSIPLHLGCSSGGGHLGASHAAADTSAMAPALLPLLSLRRPFFSPCSGAQARTWCQILPVVTSSSFLRTPGVLLPPGSRF